MSHPAQHSEFCHNKIRKQKKRENLCENREVEHIHSFQDDTACYYLQTRHCIRLNFILIRLSRLVVVLIMSYRLRATRFRCVIFKKELYNNKKSAMIIMMVLAVCDDDDERINEEANRRNWKSKRNVRKSNSWLHQRTSSPINLNLNRVWKKHT